MASLPRLPSISKDLWGAVKASIASTITHKNLEDVVTHSESQTFVRLDDEVGVRIKSLTTQVLITIMTGEGIMHKRVSKEECLNIHKEQRELWLAC